jgi:hypothetical protein
VVFVYGFLANLRAVQVRPAWAFVLLHLGESANV